MVKVSNVNVVTQQEFYRLEVLLVQTAHAVTTCLKTLKDKLDKYDRRHGVHFHSTSKHFMRHDIQVAKELAADLRYAAKRIRKNKNPMKSELTAARMSMNATADAMKDLIQSGRIYDQNTNKSSSSGGVPSIIDRILGTDDSKQVEDYDADAYCQRSTDTMIVISKRRFLGHKHTGIPHHLDTVEAVVFTTLRDHFTGFTALKEQMTATENAMSLSFAS